MKNYTFSIKALSAIMTLLVLIASLPMSVFASQVQSLFEEDAELSQVSDGVSNVEGENTSLLAIDPFEITELREEYVKYFRNSDGNYVAAQYDSPVHTLDENGKWQDIDNSLSLSGNELSTKDSRIKFAKKLNGNNELFTLKEGNTKLSLSLDGANKKAEGSVITEDESSMTKLQKLMNLESLNARVIYTEALDNVDIEYIAASGSVKENIIVKSRLDSYVFSFTMKLSGLYAQLSEDGSVEICNSSDESLQYIIPAPVAFDASGELADDSEVYYTLTQTGNKEYSLSVTVSDSWMNDSSRAFPVTIDPPVISVSSASSTTDTYVDESQPAKYFNTRAYVAVGSYSGTGHDFVGYWKAPLPEIPANAFIVDATLSYYCQNYRQSDSTVTDLYIEAYRVTSAWTGKITWNEYIEGTKGVLENTPLDYAHLTVSNGTDAFHSWNVTEAAIDWYADPSTYYGIALRQNGSAYNNALLSSSDSSTNKPRICITYKNNLGIEGYWSYAQQSAGLAGAGYVNYATGALTLSKGLLSTTDSLMPYTPSFTYNSALSGQEYVYPNAQISYWGKYSPLGFKLGLEETVIQKAYTDEDGITVNYYIWADSDGTEHAFLPEKNADGSYSTIFYDEDGLLLELKALDSGELTITDSSDTVRTFSKLSSTPSSAVLGGWYLSSITDKNNNKISFTFASGPVPTVISLTPNGSDTIDFLNISYLSNKLPAAIYNSVSGEAVIFRYSETPAGSISSASGTQYLRQIVYAHKTDSSASVSWSSFAQNASSNTNITVDATAYYEYDSSGHLISARDGLSDYKVEYTYTNGKVTSVKEYAGTTLGQQIGISYFNGYTEVRTSGSDDIYGNADDIYTVNILDSYGRVTSTYSTNSDRSEIYGAVTGTYVSDNPMAANSIESTVVSGGSYSNYVLNGSFELGAETDTLDYWYTTGAVGLAQTLAVGGGTSCAELWNSNSISNSIYQYVQLPKGDFNLSLSLNTVDCVDASVYIKAQSLDNPANIYSEKLPLNESYASNGDIFANLRLSAIENNEAFKISIEIVQDSDDSSYLVAIDNVMLQKGNSATSYNLVEQGNFENFIVNSSGNTQTINDFWYSIPSNTSAYSTVSTAGFGRVAKLDGTIDGYNVLYQELYRDSSGDAPSHLSGNYVISGFAKAVDQIPSDSGIFRLVASVDYLTASSMLQTEEYCFDFNKSTEEWQYVCGTFPVDTSRDLYCITICAEYSYQSCGYALFDNVSVIKSTDDSVNFNTYYDNGWILSHTAGSYTELYSYNDDNNVTRTINNRNECTEYDYDSYGNLTTKINYTYSNIDDNDPWTSLLDFNSKTVRTPKAKTNYSYNSYGLCTSTGLLQVEYNSNGQLLTTGAKQFYSTTTYVLTDQSRIFGAVAREQDTLGVIYDYCYDANNGRLLAVLNATSGTGECYTYDAVGNMLTVTPATFAGNDQYMPVTNAECIEYTYDSNNRLSCITTESTSYTFEYGDFGKTEYVQIGTNELARYEYSDNNGKLEKITYGNGFYEKYVYDTLENLTETWYYDGSEEFLAYKYTYTDTGNIAKVEDYLSQRGTTYTYDTSDKLVAYCEYSLDDLAIGHGSKFEYNDKSELTKAIHSIKYLSSYGYVTEHVYSTSYSYDHEGLLNTTTYKFIYMSSSASGNSAYSYDGYNRLTGQVNTFRPFGSSGSTFVNTISYTFTESTFTSTQVATHTSKVNSNTAVTHTYTYDANGNITKIVRSDGNRYRYYYDDLNQLIREDNTELNKTFVYEYDNAGNILYKKTYSLTAENATPSSLTGSYAYGYSNSEWGDLLTSYRYSGIGYDAIGNPLGYYNGSFYTFTWKNGRQLATAVKGSNTLSFEYNDEGIRTSKTVNGVEHIYYLNGSQIVAESWNGNFIAYIYDATGSPIGMQYHGSSFDDNEFAYYWYVKNYQGDILAVYSNDGVKLITYSYDAWGNVTTTYSNGGSSTAAKYNPFKYRGYYHDSETGFYYLNSRYYDPVTGRFLNADRYISTGTGMLGYNMFAYCNNNPVAMIDTNGYLPRFNELQRTRYVGISENIANRTTKFAKDVLNYDKNNESEEIVLESNYFSSYKGKLVIKLPIGTNAFSFGIMFIGNDLEGEYGVITVKHEFGHTVQFEQMGVFGYITNVAIPSVTGYILRNQGNLPYSYFSSPWEAEADKYGGVDPSYRNNPTPWTEDIGYYDLYDLVYAICGPKGVIIYL